MSLEFGTSGLRGLEKEMTDLECHRFTTAFLEYISDKNMGDKMSVVSIAGDLRPSTDRILNAVAYAIKDFGCNVEYCGKIPTPALCYHAFSKDRPSIMVTGSHIPVDRNGIKFNMPHGEVLKSDEVGITVKYAQLGEKNKVDERFDDKGSLKCDMNYLLVNKDVEEEFIKRYIDFFPPGCLKGKSIVVYQHSSLLRDILPTILGELKAKVIRVGHANQFVAIDTEALKPETLGLAKRLAKDYRLNAIMSSDGDGDRPLLFDDRGNVIRGDITGILTSFYLDADSVSATVSCNTALEKTGAFVVNRTKIGSPYVIEGMNESLGRGFRRVVSYEANGGFLTGSDINLEGRVLKALPTRDAVLPLISTVLLSKEKYMSLFGLVSMLPKRFTFSDSIKLSYSSPVIDDLFKDPLNAAGMLGFDVRGIDKIDFTDGARIIFKNEEIVHFRKSKNSPELRCYSEADSEMRAKSLANFVLNSLKEKVSRAYPK